MGNLKAEEGKSANGCSSHSESTVPLMQSSVPTEMCLDRTREEPCSSKRSTKYLYGAFRKSNFILFYTGYCSKCNMATISTTG